jgi:hypothetical protein
LWDRRINIVKISILPKAIYRVNAIDFKIPITFVTELEKNSNISMELQKILNSLINLEKKQIWQHYFQIILQIYSNKNNMIAQNKHIDQWDRIESLEINPGHI